MPSSSPLLRDVPATAIPSGESATLAAHTDVYVMQTLGGNVTVRTSQGLFRIDREHAAAISGHQVEALTSAVPLVSDAGEFDETSVWAALKTCFDPEIPVNIVDLGLVYDLNIEKISSGGHKVEVKMTLTAPGCGMGPVIAEDARQKISELPTVAEAKVHIVWDPIWTPQLISPAGRKVLGLE